MKHNITPKTILKNLDAIITGVTLKVDGGVTSMQ